MAKFFDRIRGKKSNTKSAQKAKERLQLVVLHDRINLPPEHLEAMKAEILAVISKYVSVSDELVDIALTQRDRNQTFIVAEIPFSRRSEGIDKADEEDDPKNQGG